MLTLNTDQVLLFKLKVLIHVQYKLYINVNK